MKNNSPTLFVEINASKFIFFVNDEEDYDYKLLYHYSTPIQGIDNYKIIDHDLILNIFKKNILAAEKKLNLIFKEAVIVLNNLDCSTINFSGFKKLNRSQLLKENITYLLNSLKSKIQETEDKKKIIHIFNSNFFLDEKVLDNLPIGLFGNIYSHELSFFLINNNDYNNLEKILNKCNLRLKKILSKNFIEGVNIINENPNLNTFIQVKVNKKNSQIVYFENSALKYTQDFKFGSDLVLNDISKVVGLKIEDIKNILQDSNFNNFDSESFLEKKFFQNQSFRKIKKSHIIDIAEARIQEIADIILFNNINLKSFLKQTVPIFLKLNDKINTKNFKSSYNQSFSYRENYELIFLENFKPETFYTNLNKVVQYGWNKEAIPVVQEKKTIISKIFDFFN